TAPSRVRVLHADHVAEAPLLDHPGKELSIVGAGWDGSLEEAHGQLADVVPAHVRDRLRSQDLGTVEPAVVQQHLQEPEIVGPGRVEATAAHEELWLLR